MDLYSSYENDILEQDTVYYRCSRLSSLQVESNQLYLRFIFDPDMIEFESSNPGLGPLPIVVVSMSVVYFIGAVSVPHMECRCMSNGQYNDTIEIDRMAEAYFINEARDMLDIFLSILGGELYVMDNLEIW